MPSTIPIVAAWAPGPTPIAAFDAALTMAGVGDVNIVSLSSIIPPDHQVEVAKGNSLNGSNEPLGYGDLAWCVMAEERASHGPVAAGLAWANDHQHRGGVFLEAHGTDRGAIQQELEDGIVDLIARRPQLDFGQPEFAYAAGEDEGPSSALVVAVFETRAFNLHLS